MHAVFLSFKVGANSETDGKYNTDMVSSRKDINKFRAFEWCVQKGADWYLPAIDELKLLLTNDEVHGAVNLTLNQKRATPLEDLGSFKTYWSSTEVRNSDNCAMVISMYDRKLDDGPKDWRYYVRAVAAF
jgi:hypothetical protein